LPASDAGEDTWQFGEVDGLQDIPMGNDTLPMDEAQLDLLPQGFNQWDARYDSDPHDAEPTGDDNLQPWTFLDTTPQSAVNSDIFPHPISPPISADDTGDGEPAPRRAYAIPIDPALVDEL
jgi:hypothetical protein